VSTAAHSAIGMPRAHTDHPLRVARGDRADLVLLHANTSVRAAVLRPSFARTTVRSGRIVATRHVRSGLVRAPRASSSFWHLFFLAAAAAAVAVAAL